MVVQLYPHQLKAVDELGNGKVLLGGVGTGKTITSLAYFYTKILGGELNKPETITRPVDLYIFTTARKRDELDWQRDTAKLGLSSERSASVHGIQVTVESYNNLSKFTDVRGAFFIFDEQKLVGSGKWGKSFLKIAKSNQWILLSATPGDKWEDYVNLFIANGFVKNITEFRRNHIVYSSYTKYPKVERYLEVGRLIRWRSALLVEMPYLRHTVRHINTVVCKHDEDMMKVVMEKRWHPFEERPIRDAGEMFALMRRVSYTHVSRKKAIVDLVKNKHPKLIIFYNFDYELEILRTLSEDLEGWQIAEWNGHKHEEVPTGERWVYLVQYVAGAEAWNCVTTDAIAFYSQTYSYRNFAQAQGRIDRLNTPFVDLQYYVLVSTAMIDKAVSKALNQKQNFNESDFGNWSE